MSNQRFYSKTHAARQAIKVWRCKNCGQHHQKHKPTNCTVCGFNEFHYFASKFEANRYGELLLLQMAGQVENIETQVKYPLDVNGVHICNYIADFRYTDANTGAVVVEDTKGDAKGVMDSFKLKQKLMCAIHDIKVKTVYQSSRR